MSLCRYLPTPSDRMGILWSLLCIDGSIVVEYGPAGTTHYSMGLFGEMGIEQKNRLFTTHMSEADVVMGDVSRLERSLLEVDEAYAPKVIFVVASSISALIGTDLQGVCATMQPRIKAQLVAFEQGGFRGDYSMGLQGVYRTLANSVALPQSPKNSNTYNVIGLSIGTYRAKSDLAEVQRLMDEAFGMTMHGCLCLDTSIEDIRTCPRAAINLVLREEALPAAEILENKYGVPYVKGAPYGYKGTLKWLETVGEKLNKEIKPELMKCIKKQGIEAEQYRMYALMLKGGKPKATLYGEYHLLQGMGVFLQDLGFDIEHQISNHSLRAFAQPDASIKYLPVEKERITLLKGLQNQFVLADDVTKELIPTGNAFLRVAMPMIKGVQIATHMPFMGTRGADYILEHIESYLQTLE